jgi:alpha-1,2-mannosyltransferase
VIVNTYGDLADSIGDISYVNALPVRLTEYYPQARFSSSFAWRLGAQSYDILLRAASSLFRQNVLVVNSRFTQSVVTKCLNRTSSVVYPPVDVERFKQSEKDKNRENLVVTVSRLRSGKNLELVPRIAAHVPTARFVIIGLADRASGRAIEDLRKEIERLGVGDRVQLFVNQRFQQLRGVLVSSKVFLHTQPTEAFGISIVEAMAAGCVPIVPRWGGPWFDILDLREGEYGFSYGSAEEAAKRIRLVLENEGLRRKVAAGAVKRAMGFDTSVFKRKISGIVERVCLEKNSR